MQGSPAPCNQGVINPQHFSLFPGGKARHRADPRNPPPPPPASVSPSRLAIIIFFTAASTIFWNIFWNILRFILKPRSLLQSPPCVSLYQSCWLAIGILFCQPITNQSWPKVFCQYIFDSLCNLQMMQWPTNEYLQTFQSTPYPLWGGRRQDIWKSDSEYSNFLLNLLGWNHPLCG